MGNTKKLLESDFVEMFFNAKNKNVSNPKRTAVMPVSVMPTTNIVLEPIQAIWNKLNYKLNKLNKLNYWINNFLVFMKNAEASKAFFFNVVYTRLFNSKLILNNKKFKLFAYSWKAELTETYVFAKYRRNNEHHKFENTEYYTRLKIIQSFCFCLKLNDNAKNAKILRRRVVENSEILFI